MWRCGYTSGSERGAGMRLGGRETGSGQRLGRYRLLDLIGRDGDARQHRALDANGQTVTLWTVPLARLSADAAGLERFRQRAGAAARLSHPAIPAILASGEHAGTVFVATAAVEGPTLAARLDGGALHWDETVTTLDRILGALAAAHRAGVCHGTLTAEAIRCSGTAATVTGFGLAALTTADVGLRDDLAAVVRLAERLLAGHDDRPGVAALLATLRDDGAEAFPDAGSLQRAVAALNGAAVPPPARSRSWRLSVGGMVLVGGMAALAVLNRPSPPPPPLPPIPEMPMAETQMAVDAAAVTDIQPLSPAPVSPPPPVPPPTVSEPPPAAALAQALRSIPCALVEVETIGGRLLVSGMVAGEPAETALRDTVKAFVAGWDHGFDLVTVDAQFCAPLGSVAPALNANSVLPDPLTVTLPDGPALSAGDPLVLEIRAPSRPVQLQIDYFTIDGSVVHLLPNPSDDRTALAAGAVRQLGERREDGKPGSGRSWTIGPPYGTEMLLTIAAAEALFPTARPEQEPAADYLAALAKALATLPENAPPPLADARFITTAP
ncbi:DUF4384 domain-containing protein [Azospirillum sp. B506]|uniref:DUF4384 domain-containing protein n=1 Tax=Azospirillum sp. B506 TaxID=137721 RepID=UPI001FCB9CF6|nr:DUF4384 domain-containing protein [Azospirillum sp. B506]